MKQIWTGAPAGALAFLLMMAPATSQARSADYSLGSEALLQYGEELKIESLTGELRPNARIASLTISPSADHVTMALGVYCSAYKVENSVSNLLKMLQKEWNAALKPDSQSSSGEMDITVTNGSSYRRCVEVGEMNVRCITRVKLSGTVRAQGNAMESIAISADIERNSSVGGLCRNLTRGVAVISREAALELIADAERKTLTTVKP